MNVRNKKVQIGIQNCKEHKGKKEKKNKLHALNRLKHKENEIFSVYFYILCLVHARLHNNINKFSI